MWQQQTSTKIRASYFGANSKESIRFHMLWYLKQIWQKKKKKEKIHKVMWTELRYQFSNSCYDFLEWDCQLLFQNTSLGRQSLSQWKIVELDTTHENRNNLTESPQREAQINKRTEKAITTEKLRRKNYIKNQRAQPRITYIIMSSSSI